jgi:formylglycine-generating enzyme required for sulfatase activity
METIPGTPNTPLQTAALPVIGAPRKQPAHAFPIWAAGLLALVVVGSAFGAWMYFSNGVAPTKREIEPTKPDPNGKDAVEPFRIEKPKPLVLRAGATKPESVRLAHSPATASVTWSFVDAPSGINIDRDPTPAGGDATLFSATAARTAIPGTYPVQVRALVGEKESQVEWEIRIEPFLPSHAQAAPGATLVADMQGTKYYDRIIVTPPGGKPAEFLLARRAESSDPATFYIMKDKVSVDQFRDFAASHAESVTNDTWTKGGRADGKDIGTNDGRNPVLRVTAAQAYQFARWMDGNLPTAQQWDKAAGRFESKRRPGPAQPSSDENTSQGVSVNRAKEGPTAIGSAERDVTPLGCRDMAGNGSEWTRDIAGPGNRTVPLEKPDPDDRVVLRGRSYASVSPLRFADLDGDLASAQFYHVASPHTGFRVVIDLDTPPSSHSNP